MSSSKSVSSSLMCPSVEVAAWHLDMGLLLAKQKKVMFLLLLQRCFLLSNYSKVRPSMVLLILAAVNIAAPPHDLLLQI